MTLTFIWTISSNYLTSLRVLARKLKVNALVEACETLSHGPVTRAPRWFHRASTENHYRRRSFTAQLCSLGAKTANIVLENRTELEWLNELKEAVCMDHLSIYLSDGRCAHTQFLASDMASNQGAVPITLLWVELLLILGKVWTRAVLIASVVSFGLFSYFRDEPGSFPTSSTRGQSMPSSCPAITEATLSSSSVVITKRRQAKGDRRKEIGEREDNRPNCDWPSVAILTEEALYLASMKLSIHDKGEELT